MTRKFIGIKPHRVLALLAISTSLAFSTNYYLDVKDGTGGDGLSPESAFKSVTSINALSDSLGPGDSILVKRGTIVTSDGDETGVISIGQESDGTKEFPIVIGAYGPSSSPKPIIDAEGKRKAGVYIYRVNHIVVENLEIHNSPVVDMNNMLDRHIKQGARYGILYSSYRPSEWPGSSTDLLEFHGVTIKDNDIRNIYGSYIQKNISHPDYVEAFTGKDSSQVSEGEDTIQAKYDLLMTPNDVVTPPSMWSTAAIRVTNTNQSSSIIHDITIEGNDIRNVYSSGIIIQSGASIDIAQDTAFDFEPKVLPGWSGDYYGKHMYYSQNAIIRDNYISHTAADGMVIYRCDNPLVEDNMLENAGRLGISKEVITEDEQKELFEYYFTPVSPYTFQDVMDSIRFEGDSTSEYNGNDERLFMDFFCTSIMAGIWPYHCKDGLFQYNKVFNTKRHHWDGQAFDCDNEMVGSTIFQYNYSEGNEGGFFMDCVRGLDSNGVNPALDASTGKLYHSGTIVRYNISKNDAKNTVVDGSHESTRLGVLTLGRDSTQIYNNIFYTKGNINIRKGKDVPIRNVNIYNNIFVGRDAHWVDNGMYLKHKYAGKSPEQIDEQHRGVFTLTNNCYALKYESYPETDLTPVIIGRDSVFIPEAGGVNNTILQGDPMRADPGDTDCYKLKDNSPLLNKGIDIIETGGNTQAGKPTVDFWGNELPPVVSIGAYEKPVKVLETILDEDFESGWNGWYFYSDYTSWAYYYDYAIPGYSETYVMDEGYNNHAMVTYISNFGTDTWHLHAKNSGFEIENGAEYRVSLKARTEVGVSRKIRLVVGAGASRNWSQYGVKDVVIDGDLTTYMFTFTMNDVTDNYAEFSVDMGNFRDNNSPWDVVIDDILIEKIQ